MYSSFNTFYAFLPLNISIVDVLICHFLKILQLEISADVYLRNSFWVKIQSCNTGITFLTTKLTNHFPVSWISLHGLLFGTKGVLLLPTAHNCTK